MGLVDDDQLPGGAVFGLSGFEVENFLGAWDIALAHAKPDADRSLHLDGSYEFGVPEGLRFNFLDLRTDALHAVVDGHPLALLRDGAPVECILALALEDVQDLADFGTEREKFPVGAPERSHGRRGHLLTQDGFDADLEAISQNLAFNIGPKLRDLGSVGREIDCFENFYHFAQFRLVAESTAWDRVETR